MAEPFSGLDPLNTVLVKDLLRKRRDAGALVILSTHQMPMVEELCDRVAMIDRGRLVLYGDLDEIRRGYGESAVLVGTHADLRGLAPVASVGRAGSVCRVVLRDGARPSDLMALLQERRKPVGVVDLAGVVHVEEAKDQDRGVGVRPEARILLDRLAPASAQGRGITALLQEAESPVEFLMLADKEEALQRLRDGVLQRVYLVPADYLEKGAVEMYQAESSAFSLSKARIEQAFIRLLRRSLSVGRVPEAVRARLER